MPKRTTQEEFNNLIELLKLPPEKAEILTSALMKLQDKGEKAIKDIEIGSLLIIFYWFSKER